jgi:hypothetical protein
MGTNPSIHVAVKNGHVTLDRHGAEFRGADVQGPAIGVPGGESAGWRFRDH